jgi:hypothetical protein
MEEEGEGQEEEEEEEAAAACITGVDVREKRGEKTEETKRVGRGRADEVNETKQRRWGGRRRSPRRGREIVEMVYSESTTKRLLGW